MKDIFIIIMTVLLSGCAVYSMKQAKTIENETEESIASFAKAGKTTNVDVLKKYKEPTSKQMYSDGRYSYYYVLSKQKMSGFFFSSVHIVENDTKSVVFIFDSENKMLKFSFYNNDFSGSSDDLKYAGLENIQDENADELPLIKIGDKKSYVFRKLGNPERASVENDIEILYYGLSRKLVFEIKDNVVKHIYATYPADLTEEEKSALKN